MISNLYKRSAAQRLGITAALRLSSLPTKSVHLKHCVDISVKENIKVVKVFPSHEDIDTGQSRAVTMQRMKVKSLDLCINEVLDSMDGKDWIGSLQRLVLFHSDMRCDDTQRALDVLLSKLRKNSHGFTLHDFCLGFSGLEKLHSAGVDVSQCSEALSECTSRYQCSSQYAIDGNGLARLVNSLQILSGTLPGSRVLVKKIAEEVNASTAQWSVKQLGISLAGLQNLSNKHAEVRSLIEAIVQHCDTHKLRIDGPLPHDAFVCFRNMSTVCPEISSLVKLLTNIVVVAPNCLAHPTPKTICEDILPHITNLPQNDPSVSRLHDVLCASISSSIEVHRNPRHLSISGISNTLDCLNDMCISSENLRTLLVFLCGQIKDSKGAVTDALIKSSFRILSHKNVSPEVSYTILEAINHKLRLFLDDHADANLARARLPFPFTSEACAAVCGSMHVMTSRKEVVQETLFTLARLMECTQSKHLGTSSMLHAIAGLHEMNAVHPGVSDFLYMISNKLRCSISIKPPHEVTVENVVNAFRGLQRVHNPDGSVHDLYTVLVDWLNKVTSPDVSGNRPVMTKQQMYAVLRSILPKVDSRTPCLRVLVDTLLSTVDITTSPPVGDSESIWRVVSALNKLHSSHPSMHPLINVVASDLRKSDTLPSTLDVEFFAYGLRGLNSNRAEARNLLRSLSTKLQVYDGAINPKRLPIVLQGMSYMNSDHIEVRKYICALTPLLQRLPPLSVPLRDIEHSIHSLRNLSSEHEEVTLLVQSLVNVLSTDSRYGRNIVADSLLGFQRLNLAHPAVAKLFELVLEAVEDPNADVKFNYLVTSLRGLAGFNSTCNSVRRMVNALASILNSSDSEIPLRHLCGAIYGLTSMTSDYPEVRKYISALSDKLTYHCSGKLTSADVDKALIGLRGLKSEHDEVRVLIRALLPRLEVCNESGSADYLGPCIYGVQNMSVEYEEVRDLLMFLAHRVRRSQGSMSMASIANSLFAIRHMGLHSSHLESSDQPQSNVVSVILSALSQVMYKAEFNAQALAIALSGLRDKNSEHASVRKVVKALGKLVERAPPGEMTLQQLAMGLSGLNKCNPSHVEVESLLASLVPLFHTCTDSGRISGKDVRNVLLGLNITDSGQHKCSLDCVSDIVDVIADAVQDCVDDCVWTPVDISKSMSALKFLGHKPFYSDSYFKLMTAILNHMDRIPAEQFTHQDVSKAATGLRELPPHHPTVQMCIDCFADKMKLCKGSFSGTDISILVVFVRQFSNEYNGVDVLHSEVGRRIKANVHLTFSEIADISYQLRYCQCTENVCEIIMPLISRLDMLTRTPCSEPLAGADISKLVSGVSSMSSNEQGTRDFARALVGVLDWCGDISITSSDVGRMFQALRCMKSDNEESLMLLTRITDCLKRHPDMKFNSDELYSALQGLQNMSRSVGIVQSAADMIEEASSWD